VEILLGESVFLYVWCGNGVPSNNFWTKVQLSAKSYAFLSTNILLSLAIFFQPAVQYFQNCVTPI